MKRLPRCFLNGRSYLIDMPDRFPTADERWPRNGEVANMDNRFKPKDGNKTFCMA